MRADMPWQGYERKIAPTLTKLAGESVVYTNAYTVSSYTAKSVGALLSGRYPSSLYRSGSFFAHYSNANLWFTELLQDKGIRTMAGHGHKYFDRGKNLSQGFDVWRLVPGIKWNNTTDESVTSEKMTKLAIDMLADEKNTKGQFFMWLHYMDPHDQYVQHEGTPKWGRNNRARYDSEMHHTDRHLANLFDYCSKQPWWDQTAIIVSADHGEAFGEHGMYKHAFALWEVLTHVPLFFKVPGAKPRRIALRRSQIDLAPTIVDLMGLKPDEGFVGKSLKPELFGAEPESHEPIVLDLPADGNNPPTRAVIKGDYKLIYDEAARRYRLYNLKEDKAEVKDLVKMGREKDKLAEMRKLFDDTWAKIPYVEPYGLYKLVAGGRANGPHGPPGFNKDDLGKAP